MQDLKPEQWRELLRHLRRLHAQSEEEQFQKRLQKLRETGLDDLIYDAIENAVDQAITAYVDFVVNATFSFGNFMRTLSQLSAQSTLIHKIRYSAGMALVDFAIFILKIAKWFISGRR